MKWTRDYLFDRNTSDPRIPFEIERFHFEKWAENDTLGRFMHILTVTAGRRVTLRSLADPSKQTTILKFQPAVVPAGFGRYEIVNDGEGPCAVVLLRWQK